MTPDLFSNALTTADINTTINHEPRIKDFRLAALLGFKNPSQIRALITRHRDALEQFGGFSPTVGENHTEIGRRGRPTIEYWLNKKQALYLCTKSETPNATEATIRMVEVFDAVTAGRLPAPAPVEKQEPPRTVPVRGHTRRLPDARPALPAPKAPAPEDAGAALVRAARIVDLRDRAIIGHLEYLLHLMQTPGAAARLLPSTPARED